MHEKTCKPLKSALVEWLMFAIEILGESSEVWFLNNHDGKVAKVSFTFWLNQIIKIQNKFSVFWLNHFLFLVCTNHCGNLLKHKYDQIYIYALPNVYLIQIVMTDGNIDLIRGVKCRPLAKIIFTTTQNIAYNCIQSTKLSCNMVRGKRSIFDRSLSFVSFYYPFRSRIYTVDAAHIVCKCKVIGKHLSYY